MTAPASWARRNLCPLLRDLVRACGAGRAMRGLRDPWTWAAFALGGLGFFFSAGPMPPLQRLLLAAIAEELAWRAILQEELEKLLPDRPGARPPSRGNLWASLLFAGAHVFARPSLMAALTFFPSLALGALWTRRRSLWLCAGLHLWYNFAFFS